MQRSFRPIPRIQGLYPGFMSREHTRLHNLGCKTNSSNACRERASLIIQVHWRGCQGRRIAAAARARAAHERRLGRVERLRRLLAAVRIQRFYRRYRKVHKARAAMAAAGKGCPPGIVAGRGEKLGASVTATAVTPHSKADLAAAAAAAETRPGSGSSPVMQQLQQQRMALAAVVIQACVRGWLVRRSDGLWWRQKLTGLRGRRAAVRSWQQHQQAMGATYALQQQARGVSCAACICAGEMGHACQHALFAAGAWYEMCVCSKSEISSCLASAVPVKSRAQWRLTCMPSLRRMRSLC